MHLPFGEGRLVFKAHRRVYHSTLGWIVIRKKKKKKKEGGDLLLGEQLQPLGVLPPPRHALPVETVLHRHHLRGRERERGSERERERVCQPD